MVGAEALTVEQVASLLGLSRNTVYKMAKEGTLPSYRVGRKLRFSQTAIEATIAATGSAAATGSISASAVAAVPTAQPALRQGTGEPSLKSIAAQLADSSTPRLIISGEDAHIGTLAHQLGTNGIPADSRHASSYASLVNLYCGTIDMALISMYDLRTNNYNVPFTQRLCPGLPVIMFRLAKRQRGLVVRADNPRRIRTWSSLAKEDVRIAPHEIGTGKRTLMDQMMLAIEERVEFALPPASTGVNLERIVEGAADVCLGSEEDAKSRKGLAFIPLTTEILDLVVRKTPETRDAIRTLRTLCSEPAFRNALATGGNDTSICGAITYDC